MSKSKYKPKPTWNIAPRADKAPSVPAIRLSQCMIVKDEEENIERALSWGKSIVCEQIVVDTGSTDRTVEIAQRMGAKVFHFNWINDFSAAKNYALEQASGDWIAFLDADEYLDEKSVEALRNVLSQLHAHLHDEKPVVIRSSLANYNDEGVVFHIAAINRFYSNRPDFRYVNAIHEDIQPIGAVKGFSLVDATECITIHHTGYAKTVKAKRNKQQRNIDMIKRELEKNPDDIILKGYLGESLFMQAETEPEAIPYFLEVIESQHAEQDYRFDAICSNAYNYVLRYYVAHRYPIEEILDVYEKAIQAFPSMPDYDCHVGFFYCNKKEYTLALPYLLRAEQKSDSFNSEQLQSYIGSDLIVLYQNLAICYENLADHENSIRYAVLALKRMPYNEKWLIAFLQNTLPTQNEESADAALALLSKVYDLSKLKDKLILLKAAKACQNKALAALIYDKFTPEEKDWFES